MALRLEQRQRKRGVMRRQRRAVMETRLGPHHKAVGTPIGGDAHLPRRKAIETIGFIEGTCHQGREGRLDPQRRVAFEDVAIE